MSQSPNPLEVRKTEADIEALFVKRWSPRAMKDEPLTDTDLNTFFEAGRWAASAFNNQPWRFYVARKGTPNWDLFFGFLVEGNQSWCKDASALVVVASKTTFDLNGKPDSTHAFCTGSAWQNVALQATQMGWYTHPMAGFDSQKASQGLNLPDEQIPLAMCAIGKIGDPATLPEELQKLEQPSDRRPLSEILFEGPLKA